MTQVNKGLQKLPKAADSDTNQKANLFRSRWQHLCKLYLPVMVDDSIWRYSRESSAGEPLQGWKIHISATILDACDLFERIAPYLSGQNLHFKAPKSLDELSNINSGLRYGYQMVGKFITVYPVSEKQAVEIARHLHDLTTEFAPISVPFDEQFLPGSSVFYRYGAFARMEITDKNGRKLPAVKNAAGELVADDRFQAVPEWLSDPFQNKTGNAKAGLNDAETPLTNTYKVFRAITQRGKGGTYHAVDLSRKIPGFCIVKEGRRRGEVGWNGQDGYSLVENEFHVLNTLAVKNADVPRLYSSFQIDDNFYLVMEFVDGKSLHELMQPRQRRFSIRQVIKFALEISKIIENIHQAGWIWNDCKPSNLIVTKNKTLKPIDFEGAYPVNQSSPFDWKTKAFSKSAKASVGLSGQSDDIYALGAVLYFLITGNLYKAEKPAAMEKLRRNIPRRLVEITLNLLSVNDLEISEIRSKFERMNKSFDSSA